MNVNFPQPKEKVVSLKDAPPGSIVRFTDSFQGAQTLAQAQAEPGENLFLVFSEENEHNKKYVFGYANLVSLDGEHVCCRQNDRKVVVHEVAGYENSGATTKALESVPVGSVIIYGVTEEGYVNTERKRRQEFLFIRTKETPAVTGRIPFVSLAGKKIFLDDDRMVLAVDDFVLNFK